MPAVTLCTHNKGGAGKTMLAVHCAAVLAEAGNRVLLIDCDDQSDAFTFFLRRKPANEMELDQSGRRMSILWNPSRASTKRLIAPETFDHVVIDIDTPLLNTVTTIVQSQPDRVLIPVNQQDLTLRHLPTVLALIARLGQAIGPMPKTIVVPLGRLDDEADRIVMAASTKPPWCRVAPRARPLAQETSSALDQGALIWTIAGCEDQHEYFKDVAHVGL